jgi:hypothetical protein
MYSTRKTPRTWTTSKQSLESLPLGQLGQDYKDIRDLIFSEHKASFTREVEASKHRFIRQWNATNESSYEGSFEELNLESTVRAKLGDLPDLGSDGSIIALLEDFSSKFAIKKNAEWFFSQAIARFGQLRLVKNDTGLYSAKKLFVDHIAGNNELYALVQLFKHPQRSMILDKQTDPKNRNFCSLVPIVMSAFKKFNGIGYEEWDPSEIFGITEPNLVKAMLLTELPDLTVEEVLEERDTALTVKTGTTAGTRRNVTTTYTLYFTAGSPIHSLPTLARHMMCQTWCAHPSNRTEFMILNPLKWDNQPQPLVSGDVIRPIPSFRPSADSWDL